MPDPSSKTQIDFLKKWLTNPDAFPDEFRDWVKSQIVNPGNTFDVAHSPEVGNAIADAIAPEAEQAVAYAANWTDGASVPVLFYKDPSGVVHIRGRAQRTTAVYVYPTTVFTLPLKYRPPAEMLWVAPGFDATPVAWFTRLVKITAAGVVSIANTVNGAADSGAVGSQIGFDGISFRAS